jgi:hypothetical protein
MDRLSDQIPAGQIVVRGTYHIGTDDYRVLVGVADPAGQLTHVMVPWQWVPLPARDQRLPNTLVLPIQDWLRFSAGMVSALQHASAETLADPGTISAIDAEIADHAAAIERLQALRLQAPPA